jgi:hypothetical protein
LSKRSVGLVGPVVSSSCRARPRRRQRLEHARSIVELEEASGVAVETSVQRALEGTAGLWLLNHAYLAARVGVVPAALIWLYRRDRLSYRRLRDTVLATWLLALPVFWLFPVARPGWPSSGSPTRSPSGLAWRSTPSSPPASTTPSPPSRRCIAALRSRSRSRWQPAPGGALALAWAPTIFLAVVATGNHFVFDIAAGITATGLGFGVARLVAARRRAGRRRPAPRTGAPPALAPGGGRLG